MRKLDFVYRRQFSPVFYDTTKKIIFNVKSWALFNANISAQYKKYAECTHVRKALLKFYEERLDGELVFRIVEASPWPIDDNEIDF